MIDLFKIARYWNYTAQNLAKYKQKNTRKGYENAWKINLYKPD